MTSADLDPQGERCVVIYSGGTDSTCVAALMAEEFQQVHLLTFYEYGTRNAPIPHGNVEKLRQHFGFKRFEHFVFSTDKIVRAIAYQNYARYIWRHGFFALATPGYSTMSWHLRAIAYCLENKITVVADGITRELTHFPGHIEAVLDVFRELYAAFGIEYRNPVRQWDVPPDQRFVDRLIVDRHGYAIRENSSYLETERPRTTGEYLFQKGIFPHPNIKGSRLDQTMQHDCYPFVLFNIFAFWYFLSRYSYAVYSARMAHLFREKVADVIPLVQDYLRAREASLFGSWLRA